MKIIHYSSVPPIAFDNDLAKSVTGRVLIGKNDGADHFCMRFFEIAPGGHTPRHAHDWEHEIFIHAGGGEILNRGKWHPLQAGNGVFVPANEEHQIRNTGGAPLAFICLIPSGAPEL
ncbi:MAG: cupin domain-containing protein [Deltaproteobacteria bacterium]